MYREGITTYVKYENDFHKIRRYLRSRDIFEKVTTFHGTKGNPKLLMSRFET
jgi:hypothetical protein